MASVLVSIFCHPTNPLSAATLLDEADIPQFDVFVGYDGTTVEANWFPVVCEVRNEGPTFTAMFEFSEGSQGSDFIRRMPIELPTGTLKRFSFPVYSAGRYSAAFRAVLRDEQGRAISEVNNLRPNSHVRWNSRLLGAVPASAAGMPTFPSISRRNNVNYAVADVSRLQTEMIPDNPLALAGLDALYLNSQRAVDLEERQVEAILSWLHGGGHLIIGVDAVLDVNGVPWLKGLMPGSLGSLRTITAGDSLESWIKLDRAAGRSPLPDQTDPFAKLGGAASPSPLPNQADPFQMVPTDPKFNETNIRVVEINLNTKATIETESGGLPLIVSSARGRGKLTVLLFNAELEPIRSWKLREWFWARLAEVPGELLTQQQNYTPGGTSIDGVFGAIVDSTQIRKLPVSALLLLLVVYLLVIGPLDQWWLKKINRQMLTWITFPCYVVLFSVLIYYIGYRLRAGESEWNELQIVDVIPKGQGAELHGSTYASIYSPVNASYDISGKELYASLRPEATGARGVAGSGQARIRMNGYNFDASVTVPVWTSQMFISSWQEEVATDFDASLSRSGYSYELSLNNRKLPSGSKARLFIGERVHDVVFPEPGQNSTVAIIPNGGMEIRAFATSASGPFSNAINERQQALGSDEARFRINAADAAMAISVGRFIGSQYNNQFNQHMGGFMFPENADISYLLDREQALLLIYCDGYAPSSAMNDFKPIRSNRNSLLRLSMALPE